MIKETNENKKEMHIDINYSVEIMSARIMSFDPELNHEDILPINIRYDLIKKVQEKDPKLYFNIRFNFTINPEEFIWGSLKFTT